jgi:hypothetical protein
MLRNAEKTLLTEMGERFDAYGCIHREICRYRDIIVLKMLKIQFVA